MMRTLHIIMIALCFAIMLTNGMSLTGLVPSENDIILTKITLILLMVLLILLFFTVLGRKNKR